MERIRYICPICDHELAARSYCPSCKKIIKKPIEYKGGYLPNEDIGNYILNRNMTDRERRSTVNSQYQILRGNAGVSHSRNNAGASYSSVNTDYGNCGGHKASDYGIPNVDPHSAKKRKGRGITYIILIYVIIAIIRAIFSFIFE